jgi:hypothetical protein
MLNILAAVLFATMPACPTEDSTDCAWRADVQGNGQGHSFVNVGGVVLHVDPPAHATHAALWQPWAGLWR